MPVDLQEKEWRAYYDRFPYFASDLIREGSHPRMLEHEVPVENAVVLVHGLSDSPYYMMEIARFFFKELGYNVYVPLLQCHGLKVPMGMKGVDAEEWKANVQFSVETAAKKANQVSIGGLSTGGTLSVYTAAKHPLVNGSLFLFSAALDLAGGFLGQVKEKVLRSPIADLLDAVDKMKHLNKEERDTYLIGDNPYRYSMDKGGAKQLSYLIKEVDQMVKKQELGSLLQRRVFAAHSECDTTTSIQGIETFGSLFSEDMFEFFRISKDDNVSHASLVLKHPVYAVRGEGAGEPLENANPLFDKMMNAIREFVQR